MAAFHYVALNQKGLKEKGVMEADSSRHARQLLRAKHFTVLEIHAGQKKSSKPVKGQPSKRQSISSKELALFTRQMAALLSAGLPLEEVLSAVSEQTEQPRTKALLLSVRGKVLEGHTLASSLRDYPYAFSDLYCATVAAGEKSGRLDPVLQRLADYTEQQFQMKQKIQNALIYPSLMVLVSIAIVGFLLEYVVPKMVAVYSTVNQTLPFMTQVLISISGGLESYGLYFIILVIIGIFFFRRAMKNNIGFRTRVHHASLRVPLIGNAIKTANTARFSRTFAILSSAGVPILEAMTISSALITNIPIRDAVVDAANRVREGANIYLALKQTTYFPPMSIHLIASGEASGQLENMLERAATNQEGEVSRLIDTTLTLFEPAIILIMGGVVLFIVLAVLLPIFQLNQLAG